MKEKLTKEQQEVFDSIPKEIYKLPPQEFASKFVQAMMSHPNTQKILQGNETVDRTVKDVSVEAIEKHISKHNMQKVKK